MSHKNLGDEIATIAKYEINRVAKPVKCKIIKVYDDNTHADVQTSTDSTIKYVETISNKLEVGNTGVLLFFDGKHEDYIVITK